MRILPAKLVTVSLGLFLANILAGCVQEEEKVVCKVLYSVSIADSTTGNPIPNAEVTWIRGDGSLETKYSNEKGAIHFTPYESQQNLFQAFAEGFLSKDSLDVIQSADSLSETILRSLRIQLVPKNLKSSVWIYFTVLDDSLFTPIEDAEIQIFPPHQTIPLLVRTDSVGMAKWNYNQLGEFRSIVSADDYNKEIFLDTLLLTNNSVMHTVLLSSK